MHATWQRPEPLVLNPIEEFDRIDALRSLQLLDTPAEDRFDRITKLAASFFQVPIAYVALIDSDRQWFKSSYGFCPTETSRDISFCQYTIHGGEPLIMNDLKSHELGRNHPMVTGDPFLRFYAGIPLAGPRGRMIGSFCLVDVEPRDFDEQQVAHLAAFATLVEREINLSQIIQAQNELLSTRQQLVAAQEKLNHEFADAAKYVRLMLPPPLDGEEIIDWHFEPSAHLGGDGLGYRRIDEDRLAFYMLDVTGHGLGSALLAVTALELLRSRAPGFDFSHPAEVLERLNRPFQMKNHANKFFSAWYGVYSRSARTLTYANAGHPPPVLLTLEGGKPVLTKMEPGALALGILPEVKMTERVIPFPPHSELYLFTDGLYELPDGHGSRGSHEEFVTYLQSMIASGHPTWSTMQKWLDRARAHGAIDDDVTLLRFATKS